MNNRLDLIRKWIDNRTSRDRVLLFFISVAFVYMLWKLIFLRPLIQEQKKLASDIVLVEQQINSVKQEIATIETIANSSSMTKKMSEHEEMAAQSLLLKRKIQSLFDNMVSEENIPKIIKDIYSPKDGVNLIELKDLGVDQLLSGNNYAVSIDPRASNIYRHNFQAHFQSQYFQAVKFLQYMENLPWHLYENSLEYKVIAYPQADVIINFYVLVKQS